MYDPRRKTYLAPIPYLISHYIYEYDISKANLNIMYHQGVINKEEYDLIKTFPKQQREIYFGLAQKDPEKDKALQEGLTIFRQKFLESNQIPETNLLSVKNDALFIVDIVPKFTVFDNIEFIRKNVYTSFYKLGKLEVYYYLDSVNNKEIIDVKGISDDKLQKYHYEFFIQLLCTIFECVQTSSAGDALILINMIIQNYINMQLPIEYYREFNTDSMYRISMPNGLQYLFETIDDNNKQYLNISTNLNILRELYGIISNIYFNQQK